MSEAAKVRVLPHNTETEEYLLSCILMDGNHTLAMTINLGIKPESFYVPANRIVYGRCMQMLGAGKPIELSTLTQEMTIANEVDQVGGIAYLIQITGRIPTTAQASYFAQHVKNLYRLRQIIGNAKQVLESAYNCGDAEISDLIGKPLTNLLSLSSGEDASEDEEWGAIIDQAEEFVDSMVAKKGIPPDRIIKWPWDEMNEHCGPMERGELILLGGRASTGKSSMGRACLRQAAADNHKCYFVTLEVSPYRVVLSMAQAVARIGVKMLGMAHAADVADFKGILRQMRAFGIRMSSKDKKLYQIESRARALAAQKKLDFMVIDYGGLIEEIADATDREKEGLIGRTQKRLKRLAADLDIVILELWQINRGMEKDNNREPRISDLKGSGDLEADASRIILLHRPNQVPNELGGWEQTETSRLADVPKYYINVLQSKGRDQGTTALSFWFKRALTEFEPVRKEKPVEPAQEQDDLPI